MKTLRRKNGTQNADAIIRRNHPQKITHASSGYIPSTSTALAGLIAKVRKFAAV
jgi:hypothetical protein